MSARHKNYVMSGEDSLVERFRRMQSRASRSADSHHRPLQVGIGDDAAVWRPRAGQETVLTCDWFIEGTHFLADRHPADSIGWKCLARAVSDIAAMGARPRCFLLSLALPAERTDRWLRDFLQGLGRASQAFRCTIAGGDTTRRDEILINVSVVGECRRGQAVRRSGARSGDAIFVTGTLGLAAYGLELLRNNRPRINAQDKRLRRQLFPDPRLAAGLWLARRGMATAMMDLSDGLSSDLSRLCSASRVGARLEAELLPCPEIAERGGRRGLGAAELALDGGDDYELLFTVSPHNVRRVPPTIGRVAVTRIGEITSQRAIVLADARGATERIESRGWDPFRKL